MMHQTVEKCLFVHLSIIIVLHFIAYIAYANYRALVIEQSISQFTWALFRYIE